VDSHAVDPLWKIAGWIGQACFFTRFFLQWLASERARRPVVPRAVWVLSLAGSLLVSGYTLEIGEMLLLPSFVVGGAIAVRNLWLARGKSSGKVEIRWMTALALVLLAVLVWVELTKDELSAATPLGWVVVVVVGQVLWVARFPVQWLASERAGESHFPPVFWWLSLGGNVLLLAYALHLGNVLLVLGYLPGPLLQVRNIMLGRSRVAAA
jgi:lipid-A-disaccharide synthase-like uncharacterized protein